MYSFKSINVAMVLLNLILLIASYLYCRRANEVLRTETLMFEKCVKRVEPRGPGGATQQASFAGAATTPSQSSHDLVVGGGATARVGRKRSKSRSSTMERMLRLTAEQKCDIAQREIEDFRDDIEKRREESEKVLDTFKVRASCVNFMNIYKERLSLV